MLHESESVSRVTMPVASKAEDRLRVAFIMVCLTSKARAVKIGRERREKHSTKHVKTLKKLTSCRKSRRSQSTTRCDQGPVDALEFCRPRLQWPLVQHNDPPPLNTSADKLGMSVMSGAQTAGPAS